MGSGTTLLRLVLDAHPNIAIPQETGFMRAYDAHRYVPFKASGKNWMRRLGWSDEERDEMLGELYDRMFMRYAEQHGKDRWGEKTPLHTWHIDDIARLFPDAVFIGMVRHPVASIHSNMRRFRMLMTRCRRHWKKYTNEVIRQAGAYGDRFALIRYEDLVLHPEPLMRELLEWLGEPWSDEVLSHHEVHGARGGKTRVEGKSRLDDPIDSARIAKWKTEMRTDHQEWLGRQFGRRCEFLGYSPTEPLPVAPLARAGGLVVYGREVDARIDGYPTVDFRRRRQPPLQDQFFDPRTRVLLTRDQFEWVTRPRGIRGVGAALVRRWPDRPRQTAVRAVRTARAKAGLRRRPRKAGRQNPT